MASQVWIVFFYLYQFACISHNPCCMGNQQKAPPVLVYFHLRLVYCLSIFWLQNTSKLRQRSSQGREAFVDWVQFGDHFKNIWCWFCGVHWYWSEGEVPFGRRSLETLQWHPRPQVWAQYLWHPSQEGWNDYLFCMDCNCLVSLAIKLLKVDTRV